MDANGLDRSLLQLADDDMGFTREQAIENVLVKNGLLTLDPNSPIPPHLRDALLANPNLIPIISAAGQTNPNGNLKISQEDALNVILNPGDYPPNAVALSKVILEHEYQSDNPFVKDDFREADDGGFQIPLPKAVSPTIFGAFKILVQDDTSGAFYNPDTQSYEVLDDAFSIFQGATLSNAQRTGAELQDIVPSNVSLNPCVNYSIISSYQTGSDEINVVAIGADGSQIGWTVEVSTSDGTPAPDPIIVPAPLEYEGPDPVRNPGPFPTDPTAVVNPTPVDPLPVETPSPIATPTPDPIVQEPPVVTTNDEANMVPPDPIPNPGPVPD